MKSNNLIMRKIAFLFLASLMIGCSGDDNSNSNQNSNPSKINPPAWIQGTWYDSESAFGVKFTSNDFCVLMLSNSTCYNEQPLEVEEAATDTNYNITLSGAGTSIPYKFRKLNSDEITVINSAGEETATYYKR